MSQIAAKNRQNLTVMYDREGANGLRKKGMQFHLQEWESFTYVRPHKEESGET